MRIKYKYIDEIQHYYWKYFMCHERNDIHDLNNFLYYFKKEDKIHIENWPHYAKVYFICG